MIKALNGLYINSSNCVRTCKNEPKFFRTTKRVRQRGVSPLLFICVMDSTTKETKLRMKQLRIGYRNLKTVGITKCAFADDAVLCAGSYKALP